MKGLRKSRIWTQAGICQSQEVDPQGELEDAKQDVNSLGDGMLIFKKHER